MPEVEVKVNGRSYRLACDPGQEDHLRGLAERLESMAAPIARSLSAGAGQAAESRVLLMAGLMVADQLSEAEAEVDGLRNEIVTVKARAKSGGQPMEHEAIAKTEAACAELLDSAADRLERLAAKLSGKAVEPTG